MENETFQTRAHTCVCVCVSLHINWLRQIQLTRIKILNLSISVLHRRVPPHPPLLTAAVPSAHKHKLNLPLMIALLTRRASICSRRPAAAPRQISWRDGGRSRGRWDLRWVHWEQLFEYVHSDV